MDNSAPNPIDIDALVASLKLKKYGYRSELRFENQFYEPKRLTPFPTKDYGEQNPFFKFDKELIISFRPQADAKFEAQPDYLYHGTSATALHSILEEGVLSPAIQLIRDKKLISGELSKFMEDFKDGKLRGPKFMSRAKMIERGMISADDPNLYNYGHACDVCFGAHPLVASGYVPSDSNERVIIGLDRKILELHGNKFLNGKSEGILHEGPVCILFSLKQLLVPNHRVEEFQKKIRATYLAHVFPYSDFLKD